MVRETRHLWVGNLPENVREEKIIEHFKRYGRVESVKVLPKRGSEGGVAAFVDFVDIKSAQKAHNAINKMGDRDLRTDYNEPGTIPTAARGLDDSLSLGSRGRDVSGFTRAAGGTVYGPPTSLHSRDGRYERRLDGTAESRDRAYDHSAYGHHERPGGSFERQRHYEADYYRDARERTLSTAGSGSGAPAGSATATASGVSGTIASAVVASTGTGGSAGSAGSAPGGSGVSTSNVVGFFRSHSRSPCRFETPEPRYEPRTREPLTLASVVHRDLYREDRGRRGERSYRHSRSRSPHSTHSRNQSPQRLASQATRPPRSHSGSGSRSRSSSSDSVSSTSSSTSGSDSSSSSSDDSPARSVQSAAVPAPSALPLSSLDKDEPRKSFGIKVQNLPVRSTDTSLKDGLFHEFKKHGKVTSVQIHGALEERYGLVFFRQQEDQEKALGASKGKLFFGMQIEVTAWSGPETESENEFRPLDERIDEFHPKATRTLFIGNLEKSTAYHDLLNIFQRFGEIVKVNGAPQYAFLQYCDIASVCKAIKKMDGEYLGNNRLKLGFGKSMPTTCVWLDGLASNTTEQFLTRHFCRYGHVVKVVFDRMKGMALILYNNIEYAQAAVKDTKGWKIGGSKIKVDFANQESQMAFYRSMQASGQDIRDFYDLLSERRDDRRTQYEFQAERQYYENVRTPGTYTEDPRRKYPARSREFYTEWDPYQGDYYDPQYFEDPREYREYRADPYEQDIRKYSYLQRERERERERYETDRGRDHGRRTIERSQSPSHVAARRPASPTASPALSERIPSDTERRICQSSERSGSCSSISPPRFEKLEKARTERYIKTDKLEKDRVFEVERGNLVEKEKRAGRKDRGDKDKSGKQRLKKLKVASPIIQACEIEPEPEPELEQVGSPESVIRSKNIKIPKEGSSKERLDLLPCVVQLTRVKEKEGKLIGQSVQEKPIPRGGSDSPRLASPSADQRSPPFCSQPSKSDIAKHVKVPRDKNMQSLVQVIEKNAKMKSKKHGKSEIGFDSCISVDIDRLAARKRRFEVCGKTDKPKRTSEEEVVKPGLHKLWNNAMETDLDKNLLMKGTHKKEHHKDKSVRILLVTSPEEIRDCEINSVGFSLEQQARLEGLPEVSTDQLQSPYLKMDVAGSKSENASSLTKILDDGSFHLNELKELKEFFSENEPGRGKCSGSNEGDEHIDQNVCTKQIERRQSLLPELGDPEKLFKLENQASIPTHDLGKDHFIHDVPKSIQDIVNDELSSSKRKKLVNLGFEIVTAKREHNLPNSQKLNDNIYQSITTSTGHGHFCANEEDDTAQISVSVINKDLNSPTREESLKTTLGLRHFQSSDTELPKLKPTLLGCDEELMHHWERRIKSDTLRMDMTFPGDMAKCENIRKSRGQELEPGEVQSDSDEDAETKNVSPKSSSSLSFVLRERDERMTDLKLSGSLEKNKFYSFALDKTITPDTKALLERAKTLYSSREDNWSFLPSRFPTSHSCSDKDKVELAPRPIPSWYMKKKKIRTDSVQKLHDKKEELKPHDQERQALFASRFLHSSIFEQDSRRLQHLERKDSDLETGVDGPFAEPGATAAQPEPGVGDTQSEPIVLFHSRFLELQQQKDKEPSSPDSENDSVVGEIKIDEGQNIENGLFDKDPKPIRNVDNKSASPPLTTLFSPFSFSPKERSSPEKKECLTPLLDQPVSFITEEKVEPVSEASPSHSFTMEDFEPEVPKLTTAPPVVLLGPESDTEIKEELIEPKTKIVSSSGDSLSGLERESEELPFPDNPKIEEKTVIMGTEPKLENHETKHSEESQETETNSEAYIPDDGAEIKPLSNRKQPKSKRARPLSVIRTFQRPSVASEKPPTRKSVRIDREKLKRASSPRAEVPKATVELKATSKSPIPASDSEQHLESNLIHGRTRRRNVRSVYATLHEDAQAGKDGVESARSMRKRVVDKEAIQQDVPIPHANTRRGRPPKRAAKRGEDASPVKGDQLKMEEESTEVKENSITVEVVKASEGWRSPRTQKVQQTQMNSLSPVNKKGGRIEKLCETTTVLTEESDLTSLDESEMNPKADSELFLKVSEKVENESSKVHRREKDIIDSGGKKSTVGDFEKVDTALSESRQQPEKNFKIKTPRLKRNTKQGLENKSHTLKNLEIRVSVDDVKGLLRSENDALDSLEATNMTKTKTLVNENEETEIICYPKQSKELDTQEEDDTLSEPELLADPAALLARQMELEQAVENIAKLAEEHPPRPYKVPPSEPPTTLPPVRVEPEAEVEEKRANPASETELAAAIDSITAEEMCADAESFTAPPTYTGLMPTPESVTSSSSNDIMDPETHMVINNILAADSDDGPLTPTPKVLMADTKKAEDTPVPETPKKKGRARAKTPKKSRGRKGAANRKGNAAEEVSQPDSSPIKLPESIPEDPEISNSKAGTVTVGVTAAASLATAVATCRRDVTSAMTVDTPKEAEQPEVEQPVPKESAFHSSTSNISCSKKISPTHEPSTPTLAPARPKPVSHSSVPLLRPAKIPLSPGWPPRTEESRIRVAPSCHVTVVTSSPSAALGTPSTNPPMPPDTKASDVDPSSSTLRKILMEPKYVSASNNNSMPTTTVSSVLSEPSRMSENEYPTDRAGTRQLYPEERPPLPPQPIHNKPFPLTESQQNCGEKIQHTVISPATSVISRIPMPYDTEETPRISLSNRSGGLSIPKQKFRSNSNENNRYHAMDIVEDATRGRSVVEATPYSTSTCPGLRVNTSEGVVVLSYSGQKTEGPHRMRAKISQIPPASAGDMEFQQSVSKTSTKQDSLITSSQSPTPKVNTTVYGHTGVLSTGQSYNSQPVISSMKQEGIGCDTSEAPYHTASQGGVVKMYQQPVSSPQVLMYNQAVIQQHCRRGLRSEPLPKKLDIGKAVQQSTRSPVMNPHHPSLSGNRTSPSPSIPTDRSALHLKQEPHSPRTAIHSPSHFVKACPPSSSPRGTSVVLGHSISTYHSNMHHPHPEQSTVIIQPHSVTQAMAHEARVNTSPMSGINYGRRGDSLSSSHHGPLQRSNTPQPNVIRDLVLQSHSSPQGSVSGIGGSSSSEDDPRHFNQVHSRSSVPQLQSDAMMIHSDHRGLHPSIRMDQYRDMQQRILMHQQLGEQVAVEARQSRTSESGMSSSNISGPSKSPIVGKIIDLSTKESHKPSEGKLIHPPTNESRIRGVHASSPVLVSPHSHGVQLMHPGGASSFSVYREIRGFPSQFPGHPSSGHNLDNQGVKSSQVHPEPDIGPRCKMSQSHGGGNGSKPESSHLHRTTSPELSHISRISRDSVSPSYPSPMSLTHKPDLSLQKCPTAFLASPIPAVPSSSSLHSTPDAKLEQSGHRSVDMVQLMTKYPIVWQGLLALKNDQAAVQLHFVSGNTVLAQRSLPPTEGGPLLRIVQRMRLEASQLDSVARRMTTYHSRQVDNDYCLLLALPCGRDQEDVLDQTEALTSGFITYLQAKQAAGIINVPNPGSNQPAYVVQIFPPCEFSESHLLRLAPDLLNSISSISPHLMIVIASV
ncbi:msx2-interacting protein isoform 2-T2 [Spinachia spinachia]